jgi:hypothetical protein
MRAHTFFHFFFRPLNSFSLENEKEIAGPIVSSFFFKRRSSFQISFIIFFKENDEIEDGWALRALSAINIF